MKQKNVSVCHSLKIVPLSTVKTFARYQSRIMLNVSGHITDSEAVPGSIKKATSKKNGIIRKTFTYMHSGVSVASAEKLEAYKHQHLLAIYVDENGNTCVSGSPDYPLSLDYSNDDGIFTVTLQGSDTHTDGFMID